MMRVSDGKRERVESDSFPGRRPRDVKISHDRVDPSQPAATVIICFELILENGTHKGEMRLAQHHRCKKKRGAETRESREDLLILIRSLPLIRFSYGS